MTTLTSARPGPRWRDLGWVTWRQHRAAFACAAGALAIAAVLTVVTGAYLHGRAPGQPGQGSAKPFEGIVLLLQLAPLGAGLFLGAPLLADEAEHGTMPFVLTQAVGRGRWLVAQVAPVAVALMLAGAGLGLVFRWGSAPALAGRLPWSGYLFPLQPLPFAGWLAFGFTLGVTAGALIRRLLPAVALTVAGYLTTLVLAISWRRHYLPPAQEALPRSLVSVRAYSRVPATVDELSTWLGWPSGRPLSAADRPEPEVWLAAHHIEAWITYQPASRFGPFELIEFGWLVAACVLLVTVTLALIRRRPT